MAQLSDDCFAFGGELMRLDEAVRRVRENLVCVAGVESVPLVEAVGRVLADDVVSPINVPPYDNAAVDGYAVFHADLDPDRDTVLPVVGRAAAGHPLDGPARRGIAVRIFTGAPMPAGPDTVLMQEDCQQTGERVAIRPGIKKGANRRDAGEDIAAGAAILNKGQALRPQEVGLAASIGLVLLPVYARLRVAVFSTGDEVCEPGGPLPEGALFDSNRYTLQAALRQAGCAVTDLGILPDEFAAIRAALRAAAADHDLLVTSGGMSTGEEDHVRLVLEEEGRVDFWRLAIKPGRPVGFGMVSGPAGPVPVMGLPGNPVAALTTFLCIGRPVLAALGGADAATPHRFAVRLAFAYKKKAGRREFVRAVLEPDATGGLVAHKHGRSGAGILSSLSGADGFVELGEEDTILEPGTDVDFIPFSEFGL